MRKGILSYDVYISIRVCLYVFLLRNRVPVCVGGATVHISKQTLLYYWRRNLKAGITEPTAGNLVAASYTRTIVCFENTS